MTNEQYFFFERIIKTIRSFFDQQAFHEVLIPILNESVPTEPNLFPFSTTWHTIDGDKTFYLPISPEKTLKKMLALGIDKCYAIGHTFRNLEQAGKLHAPEFLMLEWYRENASYDDIMYDVQTLFRDLLKTCTQDTLLHYQGLSYDCVKPWPKLSLAALWKQYLGVSIESVLEDQQLQVFAQQKGYSVENSTWSQLFDQIVLNEIEPHFPKHPFFLIDFPSRVSPLCAPKEKEPHLAQRFELYIHGIEIGNGNTEHTDSAAVRSVFEYEAKSRIHQGLAVQPLDEDFLDSLKAMQGKDFAGIGLGIDRLFMLLTNADECNFLNFEF